MDVTFLETKSYFCNTHPQWENKSEDLDLVDVFQIVGLGSDDEQPNIGTNRGETPTPWREPTKQPSLPQPALETDILGIETT